MHLTTIQTINGIQLLKCVFVLNIQFSPEKSACLQTTSSKKHTPTRVRTLKYAPTIYTPQTW